MFTACSIVSAAPTSLRFGLCVSIRHNTTVSILHYTFVTWAIWQTELFLHLFSFKIEMSIIQFIDNETLISFKIVSAAD